jgi:hypothetical protein
VSRRAFQPHDDGLLDQGDIFANVPLTKWKGGEPEEGSATKRAVVTSHGCVCEDYDRAIDANRTSAARRVYVQVAPLRSVKDYRDTAEKRTKLKMIENGELLDYFFIEGDGKGLEHQVADLTREQPLPASVLADDCTKIARLADWQRGALNVHIAVSRFRVDPADLFNEKILKVEPDEA